MILTKALGAIRKHMIRVALGLLVLVIFLLHGAKIVEFTFVRQLELISYDARLNLTMPGGRDDRIVIVDIDEKSLAAEGHWPWQRNKMARLMDNLFERYQVAAVGFDVVWAERDESSGLKVLEKLAGSELRSVGPFQSALRGIRPQLDYDGLFARSLKNRPVVLGYYFTGVADESKALAVGTLPAPVLPAGSFAGQNIGFVRATGYGANLPEFQQAAMGAGHFNPDVDVDGITRRVPMLMEYQGAYYEALALAVVRALLGQPPVRPGIAGQGQGYSGLEWLSVGNYRIPVDETVSALVPYRGRQGSFQYISATDVLQGSAPAQSLAGAIVLVGTTAPGLMDLRATPVGAVYPGVEIHANLIAGILDQKVPERPAYETGAEVVAMLLAGGTLVLLLPLLSPLKAAIATFLALVLVVGFNLAVWTQAGVVLPLAALLLLILVLFALNMSYGFFVESRAKKEIAGMFGTYVPPELVEEMSQDPKKFAAQMEGESRVMTVLFSDVRNFTSISEGLPPKELSKLMNEYLTPMTQVIHRHRGTIDKYIGDAIMAFWGAPIPDPDHARNALLTGLDMLAAMDVLRQDFRARGWPEMHIGVGINTGEMRVGNMGSRFRRAYTVMGDTVNLGSRLEGLTKQYGVAMIVSETTRKAVDGIVYRELDWVRVKGKNEPVAIFEPLGVAGQVAEEKLKEAELFHELLKLYRARNWDMAEVNLVNLRRLNPGHRLYAEYLERIAHFRANPPGPDWDGVYVFHSK